MRTSQGIHRSTLRSEQPAVAAIWAWVGLKPTACPAQARRTRHAACGKSRGFGGSWGKTGLAMYGVTVLPQVKTGRR